MRTLFMLGIALIIYLFGNSFIISPVSQMKDTPKAEVKISDAAWEKVHRMIERSPVDTVKTCFELFVNQNTLKTTALNCNNGKFIGLTPADDYGEKASVD